MQVQKLSSTDAFVLRDLGEGPRAIGIVRCAPKILVDGATWLARSVTYACATFEIQAGGASAGVNATPGARADALAAFDAELAARVVDGDLVLDAAKGVDAAELPALRATDPRPVEAREATPHLLAAGVLGAAQAALGGSIDGRTFAIEGIDAMARPTAAALVGAIGAGGGRVVGVSTGSGSVMVADGLPGDALAAAIEAADFAPLLGDAPVPANRLLGVAADALLAGSKAGAIEHNGAAYVTAAAVVPWGPVAFTAKALVVLARAGVVAVPDFVSTAGPLLAWAPDDPTGVDVGATGERIAASLAEVLGHEHGPFLGACFRAEAFLATWSAEKPFGRPLA